jgi:hypothetical protein
MASLIRLDDVPHQVSGELEGLGKRERLGRERQAYGMAAAELVRQARTENKVRTALSMATRWPLDGLTMASRWPLDGLPLDDLTPSELIAS